MGYGGHLGSSVQSNIMLKKPSFLLSSYSNAHCLYWSQSNSINTSTPHYSSRQHSSIGKSEYLRRCFATVRPEGLSQDQSDVFPWPKLSSRNRVPTPYEILCTEKGAKYTKKRFYELAKIYHPDRVGHANGSSHSSSLSGAEKMERYRLIVTAHEILSDVAKRSAYDASGAGWNGRPEHGIPKYNWGQNHETRWSGFDTNDSPFRNATWEDWERWYQRDKKKQEPVYFSNGGFLVLVIAVVSIGGFGQSVRVGDYANVFQRRVEKVHDDASKALRLRKQESAGFGNREERLQNFLKSRDPHGYGIIDPTEEGYRKLLPDPEVCMSEGIHQRGNSHDSSTNTTT